MTDPTPQPGADTGFPSGTGLAELAACEFEAVDTGDLTGALGTDWQQNTAFQLRVALHVCSKTKAELVDMANAHDQAFVEMLREMEQCRTVLKAALKAAEAAHARLMIVAARAVPGV